MSNKLDLKYDFNETHIGILSHFIHKTPYHLHDRVPINISFSLFNTA